MWPTGGANFTNFPHALSMEVGELYLVARLGPRRGDFIWKRLLYLERVLYMGRWVTIEEATAPKEGTGMTVSWK